MCIRDRYNPIEEYLYNTGRWDGKDRIRALADRVPCHNPHWRELVYRWCLGMVAHWRGIDKQHGNNTSPLLVGSQGYRKSTFCRIPVSYTHLVIGNSMPRYE